MKLKNLLVMLLIGMLVFAGCSKNGVDTSKLNGGSGFSQLDMPQDGEEIAVMTTNKGVIKIRLFSDAAPKAVENFKTHAKEGYYNGLIFHRVINDFMIQGGDPTGTGMGGESIWGEAFEDEFSMSYHNVRGALSMANSGTDTNGSQFFIVQAKTVDESLLNQMTELNATEGYEGLWSEEVVKAYKENGGTPWLDYAHTVFGQVFEGMDVVDTIAAVATDSNDKPVEDVIIEKIEIISYSAQ